MLIIITVQVIIILVGTGSHAFPLVDSGDRTKKSLFFQIEVFYGLSGTQQLHLSSYAKQLFLVEQNMYLFCVTEKIICIL